MIDWTVNCAWILFDDRNLDDDWGPDLDDDYIFKCDNIEGYFKELDLPILRLLVDFLDTRLQKIGVCWDENYRDHIDGELFVCLAVAEEGGWRNIPVNKRWIVKNNLDYRSRKLQFARSKTHWTK